MNKSYYPNPEDHIFYCDKSDWYTTNKKGERDWSESQDKLEEFWSAVREEKMAKKDFDFSDFIFPQFLDDNFWNENQEKIFPEVEGDSLISFKSAVFDDSAGFANATFEDKASFQGTTFQGVASFEFTTFQGRAFFANATFQGPSAFWHATFEGEAAFWYATFQGLAFFANATFQDEASFGNTTFEDKASFANATFEDKASFGNMTFQDEASFGYATFQGLAFFENATFQDEASFGNTTFEDKASFGNATFRSKLLFTEFYCKEKGLLSFYRTEFSRDEISKFSQWNLGKGQRPGLRFEEVVFPDKVEFLKCDFSKAEFVNGDLVEAKFSNCIFPKSYGRVKFINEKIPLSGSKLDHYTMVGEVYRQLKKNQMEAKNWVEAGDAYQSEMTMRRRFLWKRYWQKPWWRFTGLFSWFINVLHYLLSVYQQSMLRPVAIMFVAWIGFAGIFYWDWQHANQIFVFDIYDFTTHLLDSAFNLLAPLGRLNAAAWQEANNELLIRMLTYFERLLGGVLLTFFILATRARLKQ